MLTDSSGLGQDQPVLRARRAACPIRPVPCEAFEETFQGLACHRLDHVPMKPSISSAPLVAFPSPTTKSNESWRRIALLLEQPARQLVATHVGHVEVEQHELGSESVRDAQSRSAAIGYQGLVPHPLEQLRESVRHRLMVVDTENAKRLCSVQLLSRDFVRGRRCTFQQRQRHDELAAMAEALAPRLDGPAVQLDDASSEGEPDAEPAPLMCVVRRELSKRIENALQLLGCNPLACVRS